MTVAVLPATFDPITFGHVDIATRAARMFARLIVAVHAQPKKNVLFSLEERVAMVKECLSHVESIEVETFAGLLVDFARSSGATVQVRGIRSIADFDYEYQQAILNRMMYPEFDVIALFPSAEYAAVSSTMAKEIAEHGGDIAALVPSPVARRLSARFGDRASTST